MNTQKGFAPILIILLGLVVIGGGVYFYTQNNQKEFVNSRVTEDDSLSVVKNNTETKQSKSIYEDKAKKEEQASLQNKDAEVKTFEKLANNDLISIKEIKQSEKNLNEYEMTGEIIEIYWEEGLPNPGLRPTGVSKIVLVNKDIQVQTIYWDNKEPREIYFDEFAKIFNQKPEQNRCDIFSVKVELEVITDMEHFCGV